MIHKIIKTIAQEGFNPEKTTYYIDTITENKSCINDLFDGKPCLVWFAKYHAPLAIIELAIKLSIEQSIKAAKPKSWMNPFGYLRPASFDLSKDSSLVLELLKRYDADLFIDLILTLLQPHLALKNSKGLSPIAYALRNKAISANSFNKLLLSLNEVQRKDVLISLWVNDKNNNDSPVENAISNKEIDKILLLNNVMKFSEKQILMAIQYALHANDARILSALLSMGKISSNKELRFGRIVKSLEYASQNYSARFNPRHHSYDVLQILVDEYNKHFFSNWPISSINILPEYLLEYIKNLTKVCNTSMSNVIKIQAAYNLLTNLVATHALVSMTLIPFVKTFMPDPSFEIMLYKIYILSEGNGTLCVAVVPQEENEISVLFSGLETIEMSIKSFNLDAKNNKPDVLVMNEIFTNLDALINSFSVENINFFGRGMGGTEAQCMILRLLHKNNSSIRKIHLSVTNPLSILGDMLSSQNKIKLSADYFISEYSQFLVLPLKKCDYFIPGNVYVVKSQDRCKSIDYLTKILDEKLETLHQKKIEQEIATLSALDLFGRNNNYETSQSGRYLDMGCILAMEFNISNHVLKISALLNAEYTMIDLHMQKVYLLESHNDSEIFAAKERLHKILLSIEVPLCISNGVHVEFDLKKLDLYKSSIYDGQLKIAKSFVRKNNIETLFACYEYVAHHLVYTDIANKTIVPVIVPVNGLQDYEFNLIIHKRGLKCILLAPLQPENPIIISFRGTACAESVARDVNSNFPGVKELSLYFEYILSQIHGSSVFGYNFRQLVVCGHSLGGADTQFFAYLLIRKLANDAKFMPQLTKITIATYNAAGISYNISKRAELALDKLHRLRANFKVDAMYQRVDYDPVQRCGESHLFVGLPIEKVNFKLMRFIDYKYSFLVSPLSAHCDIQFNKSIKGREGDVLPKNVHVYSSNRSDAGLQNINTEFSYYIEKNNVIISQFKLHIAGISQFISGNGKAPRGVRPNYQLQS